MELSSCAIFSALDAHDKERLASLLRPQSFNKDEIIFLKGDSGSDLYLIRSGKVKICVTDRNGFELIFTFLSGGDLLGEMAVLDGKPRSATAIAVENTDTLYLGRKEFLEFLKTSPQACVDIITMLSQRLRRVSTQLEEVSFLNVSGRIARSILEMTGGSFHNVANVEHRLVCTISQEELARIIGASRVMVNKVLNSYVDLGFISIARKKITVLNTHELNRIACYDGNS
jgi:CRP-like cAMP-binding protein